MRLVEAPNERVCSSDDYVCNPVDGGKRHECSLLAVTCDHPDGVDNGHWNFEYDKFDSKATLECNLGYRFNGSSNTTRCGQNGQLEGFSGFCETVTCGNPDEVDNGDWDYQDDKFNSVALLNCKLGYSFSGSNTVKCRENGKWDDFQGSCEKYNIAAGETATRSSTVSDWTANRALGGECASTKGVHNPWWEVDLGQQYPVETVSMSLRKDCCASTMTTVYLHLRICPTCVSKGCTKTSGEFVKGSTFTYSCSGTVAQYIRFALGVNQVLTVCDVKVFTT